MVVDDCKAATIEENEYDQTFDEDRAPCEVERTTPGENKFVNVNTPLQLGGRSNTNIEFPDSVSDKGFYGCIKNLIHDGEVGRYQNLPVVIHNSLFSKKELPSNYFVTIYRCTNQLFLVVRPPHWSCWRTRECC